MQDYEYTIHFTNITEGFEMKITYNHTVLHVCRITRIYINFMSCDMTALIAFTT